MILMKEEEHLPSSASTGVYVGSNHNMVYGNGYFCFRPMKFLEPICMLSFYYKFKDNRGRRASLLDTFSLRPREKCSYDCPSQCIFLHRHKLHKSRVAKSYAFLIIHKETIKTYSTMATKFADIAKGPKGK